MDSSMTGANITSHTKYSICGYDALLLLLWRYSPNWALVPSILRLQASLFSANLLQFLHFNILLASLSTVSNLSLWSFQLVFSLVFILAVLSWAPFPPPSPSQDPPTGVFSIWYSWLAPFSCTIYRFHYYTCFATVH